MSAKKKKAPAKVRPKFKVLSCGRKPVEFRVMPAGLLMRCEVYAIITTAGAPRIFRRDACVMSLGPMDLVSMEKKLHECVEKESRLLLEDILHSYVK